jgi:hypothetical protein
LLGSGTGGLPVAAGSPGGLPSILVAYGYALVAQQELLVGNQGRSVALWFLLEQLLVVKQRYG